MPFTLSLFNGAYIWDLFFSFDNNHVVCIGPTTLCFRHPFKRAIGSVFGFLRATIHVKYLRYSSAGGGVVDLGIM